MPKYAPVHIGCRNLQFVSMLLLCSVHPVLAPVPADVMFPSLPFCCVQLACLSLTAYLRQLPCDLLAHLHHASTPLAHPPEPQQREDALHRRPSARVRCAMELML